MSQGTFRRARRPEQKQERREAILGAARDLAARSGVRNVSLGDIAAAVGLAKSNVVRYFGTREEIYLELTTLEWQDWERAVLERLADADGPAAVVEVLVSSIEERPLFCDLISECATTLEHNVSLEAARAFKLDTFRGVTEMGAVVAQACPTLAPREAVELVGAAGVLAGTLYPMNNPPPVVAALYAEEPAIAAARPEFGPTMRRMLLAIAAGLPTLRS
jgi:AcrR family transcriptional regulator